MSIFEIITLGLKLLGIWANFKKSKDDKRKEMIEALKIAQEAPSLSLRIHDNVTEMMEEIEAEGKE